ncbi:NEW3 domain-containing protein, partial [Nanoarchaeota archaeon]
DVERDNTFPVKVKITALEDLDNVEIEAMMSGYDHNDRVSDTTDVFDMKANVSYVKKLELKMPNRLQLDQYRLRIYVRDRAGDELTQEFYLYADTERHSVQIKDVDVDPANEVEAGRSLRVLVDLKNYGQMDEDDVKVEFAIPELGIKALPDYVDIEADETKVSEELYLRIPVCTEAGQYTGQVKVTFDEGDEVETQNVLVNVVESKVCEKDVVEDTKEETPEETPEETKPVQEKTIITVGAQSQDLTRGEGGAIYPVTFTNSGSESKTYVVAVTGADNWATVKISPLQTVTVGAGESKSVYVYVSAKETADAGEHMFTVDVKDASGNVVKQIPMTAKVLEPTEKETKSTGLKKALEIGLIVLVVILIVVALIVVFTRKKEDEEEEAEDEISGQTYY